MSGAHPPFRPAEQSEAAKLALLFGLVLAWILPGLMGHDPWKPSDAATFGVVYEMLTRNDWLVPRLAGEVELGTPPLYHWVAAASARLFSSWLPLHDGARLASGLFAAAAFAALGVAGRALLGPGLGRPAVVVLLGCVGLLSNGHEMQPEVAVLAGQAIALAGFGLIARGSPWGGLVLGQGWGIAFLAGGVMPAAMIGATALLLPVFRSWRFAAYGRALAAAFVFALPWFTIWPALLAARAPEWAASFWQGSLRPFAGLALTHALGQLAYFLELASWFAWPAVPLALWTVWGYRRKLWLEPRYQVPLLSFLVVLTLSTLSPERRDVLFLPALPPLALLAAAGIDTLRRGAANALGWFGIMGFGFAALFLWVAWFALLTGVPARFSAHLLSLAPGFVPRFSWPSFLVAATLTLLWVLALRRSFKSGRKAAVNWAAGITLFWGLLATLWLPWLDHDRSYRSVFRELAQHVPEGHDCIASAGLTPAHRGALHYHGGLITRRVEEFQGIECTLFLLRWDPRTQDARPGPGWVPVWEGSRPGDRKERFRLWRFERTSA